MQDELIQAAFLEGFLCDEHLAFDVTHLKARDALISSEKKGTKPPTKHGHKTKEEQVAWLAKQAESKRI
ncbi:hypothetical protein MKY34_12370 [Sporosarcina sp. FSL K6-1522]|uniref:hypothetical protein n=1 Tax=Sporosarcina sp. FSL K6-1522 TaxID=2921554 RepID=UPI003159A5DF